LINHFITNIFNDKERVQFKKYEIFEEKNSLGKNKK
jgi:hypothetical protein